MSWCFSIYVTYDYGKENKTDLDLNHNHHHAVFNFTILLYRPPFADVNQYFLILLDHGISPLPHEFYKIYFCIRFTLPY